MWIRLPVNTYTLNALPCPCGSMPVIRVCTYSALPVFTTMAVGMLIVVTQGCCLPLFALCAGADTLQGGVVWLVDTTEAR